MKNTKHKNIKDLLSFIGQCLALNDTPEFKQEIIAQFSTGEIQHDDFIFLSSNHFILPVIFLNFEKYGLLNIFPSDYTEHLNYIYKLNKKRNNEILNQIDEINLLLSSENIIPVYLKGTANLLDNVYSDVGERMIGDIDLLVQHEDFLKTAKLIMSLGYKNDKPVYTDVTTLKHYPRLYKTDVPADIEIHRVPVDIRFSKHFNAASVFSNKKKISDKLNCYVPSDEHKVIINFIHSQLGDSGHRFKLVSLRNLYDLFLLSKRTNASSVIDQTEEKNKIIIYFGFLSRIFKTKNIIITSENRSSERYYKIYDWFMVHPKQHHWYILIQKMYELLFGRFLAQPGKFIFQKTVRRGTIERIKDPQWYKRFINRIKNFYFNFIHRK